MGSDPLSLSSFSAAVMWASAKPISLNGTCISVGGVESLDAPVASALPEIRGSHEIIKGDHEERNFY